MTAPDWAPGAVALCAAAVLGFVVYRHAQNVLKEAEEEEAKTEALRKKSAEQQAARQPVATARAPAASGDASSTSAASTPTAAASSPPASASPAGSVSPCSSPTSQQQQQRQQQPPPRLTSPTSDANACSHCASEAGPDHKLLVCTRCRSARYCSAACQAKAWPTHKAACTAAAKARKAAQQTTPAAAPGAGAGAERRSSQEGSEQHADMEQDEVLAALGGLLQRHADGRADKLQKLFESGVVRFVKGDYRAALAALEDASIRARAEQRLELAGEALRWLGHAHNRLGAPARAAGAFADGAALGVRSGSKKLQVDCLSGLGVTARAQLQAEAAVGYLRQALAVADTMDEAEGSAAARASVLTNLGSALMSIDAKEAGDLLQEAVAMREKQVMDLHNAGENNGLATAIMEHASALVNLAGALYCGQRYAEARDAYCQSLEVFEMVGDGDKIAKSLVNLSNLQELQLDEPDTFERAAEYRRRLYDLARKHLDRDPPESCSICLETIEPLRATDPAAACPVAAAAAAAKLGGAAGAAAAAAGGSEGPPAAAAGAGAAGAEANGGASGGDGAAARDQEQHRNAHKAGRLIMLACMHCYHHGCWEEWSSRHENASCPACKQPVPLF